VIGQILLVGEDYGDRYSASLCYDANALTGQSGRHIAALSGLTFEEYTQVYARTNVVTRPYDWDDPRVVALGVARLVPVMIDAPRVILLGRRTAAAFDLLDLELLEWRQWRVRLEDVIVTPGAQISRLPHPSGRNRWWNSPLNASRAEVFLQEAVAWTKS